MRQFPPGLSEALAVELTPLGEEIIAAIAREVPAYARPLEGTFGRGVRHGVEEALARFVALVGDGSAGAGDERNPDLAASRDVYVRLGRGEVRAGRSLDNLLSAYRVGARVSWRRLGEAARRAGLDSAGLVSLAEMIFAYIDGLSAASAEGYALATSVAAGERERLWDRLGKLLLSGADAGTVEQAAAGAVRLPDRLAAVLVPGPARTDAPTLPAGCPRTSEGEDIWLFVGGVDPDRSGQRDESGSRLAGLGAIVGPTVPWRESAGSVDRARFARDARAAGRLHVDDDPLFTDNHLSALLLARDPALLDDLARRRLAPLAGLPERTRGRLAETLLHWLALRGQRAHIAQRLHVHPQTVRYRVNQLRELFGPALEDPDARFELELVLRARPKIRRTGTRRREPDRASQTRPD